MLEICKLDKVGILRLFFLSDISYCLLLLENPNIYIYIYIYVLYILHILGHFYILIVGVY